LQSVQYIGERFFFNGSIFDAVMTKKVKGLTFIGPIYIVTPTHTLTIKLFITTSTRKDTHSHVRVGWSFVVRLS